MRAQVYECVTIIHDLGIDPHHGINITIGAQLDFHNHRPFTMSRLSLSREDHASFVLGFLRS